MRESRGREEMQKGSECEGKLNEKRSIGAKI
jgi:hypothetical protein